MQPSPAQAATSQTPTLPPTEAAPAPPAPPEPIAEAGAANPIRAEAGVLINGRTVVFKLTMGALADLAKAFGTKGNFALFARLQGDMMEIPDETNPGKMIAVASGPSMEDLPAIIAALSNRAVSIDEARDLEFGAMQEILGGIGRAVAAAFPERDEKKSAVATINPTPTPTSPSTAI